MREVVIDCVFRGFTVGGDLCRQLLIGDCCFELFGWNVGLLAVVEDVGFDGPSIIQSLILPTEALALVQPPFCGTRTNLPIPPVFDVVKLIDLRKLTSNFHNLPFLRAWTWIDRLGVFHEASVELSPDALPPPYTFVYRDQHPIITT